MNRENDQLNNEIPLNFTKVLSTGETPQNNNNKICNNTTYNNNKSGQSYIKKISSRCSCSSSNSEIFIHKTDTNPMIYQKIKREEQEKLYFRYVVPHLADDMEVTMRTATAATDDTPCRNLKFENHNNLSHTKRIQQGACRECVWEIVHFYKNRK